MPHKYKPKIRLIFLSENIVFRIMNPGVEYWIPDDFNTSHLTLPARFQQRVPFN